MEWHSPEVVLAAAVIAALLIWMQWRALRRARESEDRIHRLAEAAFDGLVIHQDGKIVDANPAIARMLRTEPQKLIGSPIQDLPATVEAEKMIFSNIATGAEKPFRTWIKRFDGTPLRVEFLGKTCTYRGRQARIVAVRDLSEQTRLEERFESFFSQAPFPVQFYRPDGTCTDANAAWERLWDISAEVARGYNILQDVHAQSEPKAMAAIRKAFGGEAATIEPMRYDPALNKHPGRVRWIETHLFPLKAKDGTLLEVAGVLEDVTEREDLLEKLRRALQIRDEFLSIASHELKTPLTPLTLRIQSAIQKVESSNSELDRAEIIRMLRISDRQVSRLTQLVDELLDISRMREGKLKFRFGKVDLVPMVHELVARYAEEAKHHGSRLALEEPGGAVLGDWDGFRLEQVLVNLLSNAIKYGAGREIEVRLDEKGDAAFVQVSDHGIGIPAEHLDRIFERFERVPSSHNIAGMGLGLYIAREIVAAHGGSIEVVSAPGQGSTFTVKLPKTRTGNS